MKNIIKSFVFILLTSLVLGACTKEENKISLTGGTPPVLSATVITAAADFNFANEAATAIDLNWTNPNYEFTTGVSSQDVTYKIQIDTVGSNFTNPKLKEISVSKNLTYSFLVSELNEIMLNQLELIPGQSHDLEMRVISTIGTSGTAGALVSNVVQYTGIVAYSIPPKVTPPASGTLFIVGSATLGGWNNPMTVDPATQQFTQVSPTLYEITLPLNGGGSYKWIAENGSWNVQYSIAIKNDPDLVNGGDFKQSGDDILAPAASGSYKISVDFQKGKFTVTPQ